MAFFLLVFVLCFWLPQPLQAQEDLQPRWLIDSPTAGLLPRGSFAVDLRMYGDNGILTQLEVGLFSRAGIGVSFGGEQIVGSGGVRWNPRVEFMGRVRVFEEGGRVPALALGFQSQGYGAYDNGRERYNTKSKGFYGVLSKNFGSSLGDAGFHGGVNRSLEDGDGDHDMSGFVGVDKQFGKSLSVLLEYDFALNDNEDNTLGSGRGLFNAGGRWTFTKRLTLEFDLKNIFRDGHRNPNPDREIRLLYYENF